MRIVFLDIDGVLNKKKSEKLNLDPEMIHRVAELCFETRSDVVVSSNWRTFMSKASMEEVLGRISYFIREDWRTPEGVSRGHEIDSWHRNHAGIERYVILDDLSPDNFLQHQQPFHVRTKSDEGFQKEHYKRAMEILIK